MNFEEFSAFSPLEGKNYQCRFYKLATGIAPRHSDTVDIQFLVNGKVVAVALAHPGLVEFRRQTGRSLTDSDVIRIAALALKELLEKSEWTEESLVTLSPRQTVEQAQRMSLLAAR